MKLLELLVLVYKVKPVNKLLYKHLFKTSQQVKLFGIFSETRWQLGNFLYVLLSYQSNKWWIGACGQIK